MVNKKGVYALKACPKVVSMERISSKTTTNFIKLCVGLHKLSKKGGRSDTSERPFLFGKAELFPAQPYFTLY